MVRYPEPWDWANEARPAKLSMFAMAPDKTGFYELGEMTGGQFVAKYCGRAMNVTLKARFKQHYTNSHNLNVRANTAKLFFRYKVLRTPELAAYVEAVHIAAMDYPWNRRNEWAKHWILES